MPHQRANDDAAPDRDQKSSRCAYHAPNFKSPVLTPIMHTTLNPPSASHTPVSVSPHIAEQIEQIRRAIAEGNIDAAEQQVAPLLAISLGADRARALNALATLHRAKGDILGCARVASEARHAAHMYGDIEAEAEAILQSGLATQMIEDHAAAIAHFEEAEQLAVRACLPSVEARVLHRLGISASIIGRHAQAIDYLERSVRGFEQLGNTHDGLAARNSLLNAYSRRAEGITSNEPERRSACLALLPMWDELAREAEAASSFRIAALARGNYAITQRYAEDYEGALITLREVLQRYESYKMRANIAITYNEIGTLSVRLNRHKDALAAYEQALLHLVDGSKREQRDAYVGISEAHEALGDTRAALYAIKKVREIESALTDEEARSAIERRELTLSMRRLSDEWERLAKEDALTALPNRRALEQWMHATLSRATSEQPTTLLMIDVDHFKQVNDKFGHATGDIVLRMLADLMRQNCRYADLPARFGGEEFILAMPQTELSVGKVVAQRLNIAVAEYDWQHIQPGLAVTISIGVATTAEMAAAELSNAMNALFEAADRKLYEAKNSGRNRVVV
jgi:diguanylate cyclase (GGDEF)-like protein